MESIPPPTDEEIPAALAARLAELPRLNIYRLLTLVPETFEPWFDFVAGIYRTDFDPRLREIAILRYGARTQAAYEIFQHSALSRAKGVSDGEIEVILRREPVESLDEDANFVCRVVDEFEDDASITDGTRAELMARFGRYKAMVLLVTLGHYSCVCRVLNASGLPREERSPLEDAGSPTG